MNKVDNKIIEVQDILFKEMKRIDNTDGHTVKEAKLEFSRATALYNMSTGFIKTLNANLNIMNLAKRTETKYETLMKKLCL